MLFPWRFHHYLYGTSLPVVYQYTQSLSFMPLSLFLMINLHFRDFFLYHFILVCHSFSGFFSPAMCPATCILILEREAHTDKWLLKGEISTSVGFDRNRVWKLFGSNRMLRNLKLSNFIKLQSAYLYSQLTTEKHKNSNKSATYRYFLKNRNNQQTS